MSILVVVILCFGFCVCASTNVQFDYFVGTHIDDAIEAEGEASEVYYDDEVGNVYVWESGTFGDAPTRVSFYASGDGMVTGWSVAGEIPFDKFSDLFKFLKPQDGTNQEEEE